MKTFKQWVICNLFHRRYWLGLRELERMKLPLQVIRCLKCEPLEN
jgi:hypothetical protein